MILYFTSSFRTPCSLYARCLPSLSLILGADIGGPSGEPRILGGGGRIARKAHARKPPNNTANVVLSNQETTGQMSGPGIVHSITLYLHRQQNKTCTSNK